MPNEIVGMFVALFMVAAILVICGISYSWGDFILKEKKFARKDLWEIFTESWEIFYGPAWGFFNPLFAVVAFALLTVPLLLFVAGTLPALLLSNIGPAIAKVFKVFVLRRKYW